MQHFTTKKKKKSIFFTLLNILFTTFKCRQVQDRQFLSSISYVKEVNLKAHICALLSRVGETTDHTVKAVIYQALAGYINKIYIQIYKQFNIFCCDSNDFERSDVSQLFCHVALALACYIFYGGQLQYSSFNSLQLVAQQLAHTCMFVTFSLSMWFFLKL